MHPRQTELLKTASELAEKIAAKGDSKQSATPLLWKYTDPDGKEFWLKEKRMTVRSPYSGKTFTSKPEKETLSVLNKGLRDEMMEKTGPAEVAGPGPKTMGKKQKKKASDDWKA